MLANIQLLKSDVNLKQVVLQDFSSLLQKIGLPEIDIEKIKLKFLELLDEDTPQSIFEGKFRDFIFSMKVNNKPFSEALENLQISRSERIYSEIVDFVQTKNKVLDFGCGNGLVGQLLFDKNNIQVEGCDVVIYSGSNIKIPIHKFDGHSLNLEDDYFEMGYANSVLHHDERPDEAIKEITRVVSKKFLLIEDTIQGSSQEDKEFHSKRLFLNDYIYNRLLTNSDIPVPGTYRTSDDWTEAFTSLGWKLVGHKELGWSKILFAVFRERFIFERK